MTKGKKLPDFDFGQDLMRCLISAVGDRDEEAIEDAMPIILTSSP